MQPKWEEQFKAMRQKLAQQNEQWARAKDLLASSRGPIPISPEFIEELDRVCDVTVRPMHPLTNIYNGAIRV